MESRESTRVLVAELRDELVRDPARGVRHLLGDLPRPYAPDSFSFVQEGSPTFLSRGVRIRVSVLIQESAHPRPQ
jgi:hypothetical protein